MEGLLLGLEAAKHLWAEHEKQEEQEAESHKEMEVSDSMSSASRKPNFMSKLRYF